MHSDTISLPGPTWPDGSPVYPEPNALFEHAQLVVCQRCSHAEFDDRSVGHVVTCPECQETVFLHSLFVKNLLCEGENNATWQTRN